MANETEHLPLRLRAAAKLLTLLLADLEAGRAKPQPQTNTLGFELISWRGLDAVTISPYKVAFYHKHDAVHVQVQFTPNALSDLVLVVWNAVDPALKLAQDMLELVSRYCISCRSSDFGDDPSDRVDPKTGICGMCTRKEAVESMFLRVAPHGI